MPWRLLSFAMTSEGTRRNEAVVLGSVGLQVLRDWILHFSAERTDGLIGLRPPGATPKLNEADRRATCEFSESGPILANQDVVRRRLKDLAQWIWDEFRIS